MLIPTNYEYALLIIIFTCTFAPILAKSAMQRLKQPSYYLSLGTFVVFCFILELVCLSQTWWSFSPDRVLGFYIANVPIEEVCLFFVWHFVFTSIWRNLVE